MRTDGSNDLIWHKPRLVVLVDAPEDQDVVIIDIPNAFIQMDMEGKKGNYEVTGQPSQIIGSSFT